MSTYRALQAEIRSVLRRGKGELCSLPINSLVFPQRLDTGPVLFYSEISVVGGLQNACLWAINSRAGSMLSATLRSENSTM